MIERMVVGVKRLLNEYDEETLEGIWQSLYKRYNEVFKALAYN